MIQASRMFVVIDEDVGNGAVESSSLQVTYNSMWYWTANRLLKNYYARFEGVKFSLEMLIL